MNGVVADDACDFQILDFLPTFFLSCGCWVRQSPRAMLGKSVPALAPAHAACAPAHALHAAKVQLQAVCACGGGSVAEEAGTASGSTPAVCSCCGRGELLKECTPNGTPSCASAHSTKKYDARQALQRLLEWSSMQKVFIYQHSNRRNRRERSPQAGHFRGHGNALGC